MFVEAEFHAVWQKPDGRWLDIAPKKSATARVFFLHDPVRHYEGRQVNNVRRPVVGDPQLQAHLDTYTAEYDFLNRGDRVGHHGEISLLGAEAAEYEMIQAERAELYFGLLHLLPRHGPYLPCPCGSGKKMKWCHKEWD